MCQRKSSVFVLSALRGIRSGVYPLGEGLCSTVLAVCRKVHGMSLSLDDRYFASWPEFSGDFYFPVPHIRKSPLVAFSTCKHWSKRYAYGQARWRLLDHLIECYEKELGL